MKNGTYKVGQMIYDIQHSMGRDVWEITITYEDGDVQQFFIPDHIVYDEDLDDGGFYD